MTNLELHELKATARAAMLESILSAGGPKLSGHAIRAVFAGLDFAMTRVCAAIVANNKAASLRELPTSEALLLVREAQERAAA